MSTLIHTPPGAIAEKIPEAYGISGQCFKCTQCQRFTICHYAPPAYEHCDYCGEGHNVVAS